MFLKQRDKNFDKESHKYTHFFFLTFAVHMISKLKETNLEHLRQLFLTSAEVRKPVPKTGSNSSLTYTSQLQPKTSALQMFALHWADWWIWKWLKFTWSFLPKSTKHNKSIEKIGLWIAKQKNKHTHEVNVSRDKF